MVRIPQRRALIVCGLVALATFGAFACDDSEATPGTRLRSPAGADGAPPAPGADAGGGPHMPQEPSKGCNGGAARPATKGLSTGVKETVSGDERSYDLAVPPGYDPTRAYPIVFVFHGSGGRAEGARETFSFESFVGDEAIFVYPQGRGDWDLDTPAANNSDVVFFDQVLAKLEGDLCVDAARVFATGFSNGAYFANQLGCRRGGKLRAVASHGGGGPYEGDDGYDENGNLKCAGPSPAALVVHGVDDGVVSISEAQSSLKHWKWANGCGSGESARSPEPCVAFDGCSPAVVTCQIPGLGHGVWDKGGQVTWDFFAGF